jgi:glycosyltransferase involved in cell wall biosynthesis
VTRADTSVPDGPLHILQVNTRFGMGGISRHVLALGGWLSGRGHKVHYAGTPGAWLGPAIDPDFVELDVQKVSAEGADPRVATRLRALASSARGLSAWLRRNPVDVIHAHESAPALVAKLATALARRPIVVTYHGSGRDRVGQFASIARYCADRTISVSHHSGGDLVRLGGLPAERLEVIGLGVIAPPPVDPARVAQTRARLLGPDGRFLSVTVARLTEQKGIDVLVRTAARVVSERPDARFVVVGDGCLEAQARGWAEEAGVAHAIQFVGRSEEVQLYYAAADLFLLASRWEALPFTIAEAFQAGLPAVATDCGGVGELIDDSVGRVLPVGDDAGLARAVLEIAADGNLRSRLGESALARSREDRFKPDYNHRRIEAVYRALVANPRASR